MRSLAGLVGAAAVGLASCTHAEPDAALEACETPPSPPRAGWRAVSPPGLSFRLPPIYVEESSDFVERDRIVSYRAPGREVYYALGPHSWGLPDSISGQTNYVACRAIVGGRMAKVARYRTTSGRLSPAGEWNIGAYWGIVHGDSGLVLIVAVVDSTDWDEAYAILYSAELPEQWRRPVDESRSGSR
jgi:hypothetical protein